MKLTVGRRPDTPEDEYTGPPEVPCELKEKHYRGLDFPDLPNACKVHLDFLERSSPRTSGLHVSDLGYTADGGLCPRALWLREHGAEGAEPTWERKFGWREGHIKEAWLADMLAETVGDWHLERNLTADLVYTNGTVMTGELDMLLTQPLGRQVILDAKCVEDQALARLDAPRPSNVCQMQGYLMSHNADFGVLVYMGRWSVPRAFYVPRDDAATHRRMLEVYATAHSPEPPKVLAPKKIKGNVRKDGSRFLRLGLPWPCDYCPYLDTACDGALRPEHRNLGTLADLDKDGKVVNEVAGVDPQLLELLED